MSKLPSKTIQDELPRLKKMVVRANDYFKPNYHRFNDFRKLIYKTSISEREKSINNELQRPNIEVNVLTAYISRLDGEFAKQEPSIEVSADEGEDISPQLIQVVEGHIRHIFEEAKQSNTQYHTYRDSLSGGFGVMKVYNEYANERTFKQVLKVRKAKYPTMCGFDPLATEPHKGDGNFCFELYPKTKTDFKEEYPDLDISDIKFSAQTELGGFQWAFSNEVEDVILICKLYLKKKKSIKIHELADGQELTDKEYKDFVSKWESSGTIAQAPVITRSRKAVDTVICCYTFIESTILEYEETDYGYLPLVFDDGDSIDLYDNSKGTIEQFTRPYVYNAIGAQQLKNLAAQSLSNYLENMAQHKYLIKREAIPLEKEYLNALTEPQKANTLVVNAYMDNDPNKPIPEPLIPLQPQACPPEVSNAIGLSDQIMQNELGSYDAALGINDNQLSGIAIIEAATQSNAAAMPYVVNYLTALQQVAVILVDLMPKYYRMPMNLPIIDQEGKKAVVSINQNGQQDFNYDSNAMKVRVTAGVNFAIQKSRALQQIIALMQASPAFAQFMNTKGLPILLDNIEIRGADILKKLSEEYQQEMKQQQMMQQQMQQHAMQNNPQIMTAQAKQFDAQSNAALKAKELQLKEQELAVKVRTSQAQEEASLARAHAEETRANMEVVIKHMDMEHRHGKDVIEMAHKIHGGEENATREKQE